MNLWTRIEWSDDLDGWQAEVPAFGGSIHADTVLGAMEGAREYALATLQERQPKPVPERDTAIGALLVRGRVILPHQVTDAASINDVVVVGFRVAGKVVTPPMLIVVATLIDDLFS